MRIAVTGTVMRMMMMAMAMLMRAVIARAQAELIEHGFDRGRIHGVLMIELNSCITIRAWPRSYTIISMWTQ